jgi:hypothetical protein
MRDWWLRTVLVLTAPRAVFVALRDESDQSLSDRAEPVLLIVLLAGMALALASSAARGYGGVDLAAWTFIAGSLTGGAAYWLVGAVLHGTGRAFGSQGTYRRARHVLAFASVPIAISLVLAPIGLRRYGYVELAFVVWAGALLLVGVRSVHAWTWPRSVATVVVPAAVAAALALL